MLLGDVEERVKLLKQCNQKSLAYVMAATHGLDEQAEQLKESLDEKLPEINPNAELILPPCPISQQESNWPLLAVSKGFFEGAMIKGNQPPSATTGLTSNITTKLAANVHIDETGTSGGDWADDDVQVELDEDDINK
jgi:coatomer protein complex subunit alpha (xenin)